MSIEYQLFELSKSVGSKWRMLGQLLKMNIEHMDCIERDIPTTRERAMKMLQDWYCACGRRGRLEDVRSKVAELQRTATVEETSR